MAEVRELRDESETRALGAEIARRIRIGDWVRLEGPLGAGKTTLVRGLLHELGHRGPVRSPTFQLIALYETDPPCAHADLYRLPAGSEIGLEEYLVERAVLVEWPERGPSLAGVRTWTIRLDYDGEARRAEIEAPSD